MTKVVYFSFKAIALISSNLLVTPLAQIFGQVAVNTPPVLMFFIFNALLFSHELMLWINVNFRNWIVSTFEDDKGKADNKQIIASYLSLWCIRLFVYGKLVEVHYDRQPFNDQTYYYLIVIILILVGGVVVQKSLATVLQRFLR
jgi:hypothetical protein